MFQIHDGTLGVREGKNSTYQATCAPRHPLYGSPLDTLHNQEKNSTPNPSNLNGKERNIQQNTLW
jgi:hypothetical protein